MIGVSPPSLQNGTMQTKPDTDNGRLRAYLMCLIVAFSIYCLVNAFAQDFRFLVLCGLILVALVAALILPPMDGRFHLLVQLSAIGAGITSIAVPFASEVQAGRPLAVAVEEGPVWPQILVLLFAARVLAEACEQRFVALWKNPLGRGSARTQSMSSALLLGSCLTLIFYQLTGSITIAPERLDPWAIVVRAFTGTTVIHAAIVLLFFVVVAAILDAALLAQQDSAVLRKLRDMCRARLADAGRLSKAQLAQLAGAALPQYAHTRTMHFVREAIRNRDDQMAPRSLEAFHAASRHLIRALLAFIPLLGFLGTVIGLTAAVGGLPGELQAPGNGNLDIGASLLGLAVKFETTLLGLAGALVASLLLALLEKREGEISAECFHLVEMFPDDPQSA